VNVRNNLWVAMDFTISQHDRGLQAGSGEANERGDPAPPPGDYAHCMDHIVL
jgi:hypothetical protein